jgi:hypothetical protein
MLGLRRELDKTSAVPTLPAAPDEELQREVHEAGLLSELKPPITDLAPYQNRKAVPIRGESPSEAVIRERRYPGTVPPLGVSEADLPQAYPGLRAAVLVNA